MPGPMETRIAALVTLIDGATSAPVLRNRVVPVSVGDGVVIVRDGDPGPPSITLPLTYHYDHTVEVEIYVQAATDRQTGADTIKAAIGAAVAADRTLGGLCDWIDAQPASSDDLPIEGAEALRQDILTVTLSYGVSNPLT